MFTLYEHVYAIHATTGIYETEYQIICNIMHP